MFLQNIFFDAGSLSLLHYWFKLWHMKCIFSVITAASEQEKKTTFILLIFSQLISEKMLW